MKFKSLKVDRFGSLADFELEFNADAPMQVLFGPNEAGKSTFLGLIRELLFGFPHSGSDYHYSGTGRQIAAEARLAMADHTTLHFRREKGVQGKQVQGQTDPSGESIDDATLLRRLGGISQPFYENVFGFSLGELTAGEESLKKANLDEALYGTGLGGLKGLQAVQSELADESDKLWLSRGKKQQINHLIGKVKESTDTLRASMLRPDEYEARLQRHQKATDALEKIRAENETSRRTLKHLERLRDALGPYQERTAAERQLQKLEAEWGEAIQRFPQNGRQMMDDLRREIQNARQRLVEIDQQITEATDRIDSLEGSPAILEQESKIQQLFQTLKQIRDYRDEIPRTRQELEAIDRQVLATLHELDPSWTIDALDRYQVSLDRRTRIEEMADESNELEKQRTLSEERKASCQKELDVNLAKLDTLASTVESAELLAIMERQPDYAADQRRRQELEELLEGLHWKAEEAARKLFCVPGLDHEGLDQLTVPLEETIREFADRFDAADLSVREAGDRLRQAETELHDLKAQRDEVESAGSAPTLDQLEAARTVREKGWELLRRQYIEAKKVPKKSFNEWLQTIQENELCDSPAKSEMSDEGKADLYESVVKQADRLADVRQEKAKLVASLDGLARRITATTNRREEYREQFEATQTAKRDLLAEWHAVWKPCEIEPLLPEEMLRWLENHAVYLTLLQEAKATEAQAKSIDRRLKKFEKELRQTCLKTDLLTDTEEKEKPSSPETLLATVKHHVDQCRESQVKRQELQNRSAELKSERKQLDQTSTSLAKQAKDWSKRWTGLLEEIGLPIDWTPKMADVTLRQLHDVRREHQKIGPMETRLNEIEAQIEQFERKTVELCQTIAKDLAEQPSEQAVETLHARLEEAKRTSIQRQNAIENREAASRQKETVKSQLDELTTSHKTLLETTAVESDEAFYEVANHADNHRTMIEEIQRQTDQIDRFITNEEQADEFWKELEAIDADTFDLRVQQAKEEDERITKAREEAAAEASLAAEALKELDQTDQTIRASAELESYRSELREVVDRWATLTVARALIDDAVRRFERENQPEMLDDIRRLFALMTADRYGEVRRRMNEQGSMVIVEQDGTEKDPSQLSTGTREQLYLAMRLAYVLHYCHRNEPLPLVMDDVLVNFDAVRAAGTIDALAEVARSTQIIFLTCHQHTVDLIATRLPDVPVRRIGYNGGR
ncbi:MAG: AAA family ATPase [Planctomycetia bacterium]|jgi:uncharacterized protein YhaN